MKIMYSTKAVATGGRNGQSFVQDTPIRFEMASPAELGGGGKNGLNHEQLFAAGYAACFGSALEHVFKVRRLKLEAPEVHVTVGIGKNEAGGFALAAQIVAILKGLDQAAADGVL